MSWRHRRHGRQIRRVAYYPPEKIPVPAGPSPKPVHLAGSADFLWADEDLPQCVSSDPPAEPDFGCWPLERACTQLRAVSGRGAMHVTGYIKLLPPPPGEPGDLPAD